MSNPSSSAALARYLGHLPDSIDANLSICHAADGSAHGQFFACRLTSEFQPIHAINFTQNAPPVGFEGLARGVAASDKGLSVWRMLDQASSDGESIALDRLCRVLHAMNYFRQTPATNGADLYLSVHDRLLAAVSSNHGDAFLRVLNALGLPSEQIVLQLPAIGPASRWLLDYVADNYRRNGFRLALSAVRVKDAVDLVTQYKPYAVTIDARALRDRAPVRRLAELARDADVRLVVKRVDTAASLALLEQVSSPSRLVIHAQGDWLDASRTILGERKKKDVNRDSAFSV
jgi:EAL domain-containing protein (putative c-di-GMP-specific phosphodiesterase class I)